MNEEYYKVLNAKLGAEFDLFAVENPDRDVDQMPRPLVLVHIRELLPPRSRIVRADAELLAS